MSENSEGINPSEVTSTQKASWKDKIGKLFGKDRKTPSLSPNGEDNLSIDIKEVIAIAKQDDSVNSATHPEGIPPDLRKEYEGKKSEIEELYVNAAYWHGTGRKQYKDGQVIDLLNSIVNEGGLTPHNDPFDAKTGIVSMISLSDRRMYAGGYARMHIPKSERLRYEYMSDKFWGIFLKLTAREVIGRTNLDHIKKIGIHAWTHLKEGGNLSTLATLALNLKKNGRKWVSRITKEEVKKPITELFTIHSDIPGNYPILIGVKDGIFTPSQTANYISKYETRANTAIPINGFTHIEVPLAHIQKTQDYLNQRGVGKLPVVAMELGEIHSSQFSPQQLIQGNPFRR